jgi:hypothetical protein
MFSFVAWVHTVFILDGVTQTLQGLKTNAVSVSSTPSIKNEPKEDTWRLHGDAVCSEVDEFDDTVSELTLLGSIKATVIGNKIKKKKNGKNKLDAQKLLQGKFAAQQEEQV